MRRRTLEAWQMALVLAVVVGLHRVSWGAPEPVPAKAPQLAPAATLDKTGDFLRFVDGAGGARLETADVVFVNENGTVVRLVSAVHIAEKEYFRALADSFKQRDAVLYEMVKPKDAALPAPGAAPDPDHPVSTVSQIQRILKDTLNLSFQLDEIDYTQPNFIHADLDAETFAQKQSERGESMMTLMLQSMMKALANPPVDAQANAEESLEDLVRMICRPDGERQMKLFLAKNMTQFENDALGLDGPGGSVILTERNKAAIDVLQKTLADGKRDVAVFYGAAHMPDMSKRLSAMGFRPVATEWRMAWDLSIRPDEPSAIENMLLELLRGMED